MATNYYVILTKQGKELLANALANESILDFTQMAVGDGGGSSYEPDENQTSLRNETYRSAISSMKVNEQDSNVLEFEFVVPASSGGYYIREAGLFAGETLVAVAKMGDNYKPEIIEGAGSSMTIRFMLAINNEYNAVINISESIEYATKTYVNEKIEVSNLYVEGVIKNQIKELETKFNKEIEKMGKYTNKASVFSGEYGGRIDWGIYEYKSNYDVGYSETYRKYDGYGNIYLKANTPFKITGPNDETFDINDATLSVSLLFSWEGYAFAPYDSSVQDKVRMTYFSNEGLTITATEDIDAHFFIKINTVLKDNS